MPDTTVRIPREAKERLAAIAAGEGLSLRAYLVRLADTLLTPREQAQRAQQAEQVCAAPHQWAEYAPSPAEQQRLDEDLDRRLARAVGR
ncbi:hypothetical protein DMH18_25570 [Streptomyces sp. WAC 06783]|uniref:hypothetical protein n=1 Tax=Streptomyces sp. WAC 06783 TaxID=2203211 RepID=UPI000F74186E|nr:hypothetical protein [Streptomyces sp. WAC 06783]RSO07309.1 hypothetical protein DMH18_25570 [Streptomyces sp. WAC 06783]